MLYTSMSLALNGATTGLVPHLKVFYRLAERKLHADVVQFDLTRQQLPMGNAYARWKIKFPLALTIFIAGGRLAMLTHTVRRS